MAPATYKTCEKAIALAVAIMFSHVSYAQDICEELSIIVKAIGARDSGDIMFMELPGATCEVEETTYSDRLEFMCEWPRPQIEGDDTSTWRKRIEKEVKSLAGQIHQCIRQEMIPYSWGRWHKERDYFSDSIESFYTYTERRDLATMIVCANPMDSLRFIVRSRHRSYYICE